MSSLAVVSPEVSLAGEIRSYHPTSVVRKPAERIPTLDGLRGVAILLVLLRHSVAGTETSSSFWSAVLSPLRLTWSGVDLFFVLSGFLIGGILMDARHSKSYFRTFYLRRAFRILPVYAIFISLYLGRHLHIPTLGRWTGDTSALPVPWWSFLTFTQNFWMTAFGWFGPMAIAPTWSLAVEEQFYLTIPFLIRRVSRKTLLISLLAVIAAAPLLRSLLPHVLAHGGFGCYILMPCRADALCMGVLAALLVRTKSAREWVIAHQWVTRLTIAITFVGIVFLTYAAPYQYSPPMSTWGLSCLAFFYACILLSVVCGTTTRLCQALKHSVLMKLGQLAYCSYLVHSILMEAARNVIGAHTNFSKAEVWASGGIVGIAAALVVASISWKYLEQPLLRYGHKYTY
jgi:peptidoglycan/LPS O-acetylase OafA/YrhL